MTTGTAPTYKLLRALHSALRARNVTGDKNRTGPVVGCDWGINVYSGLTIDRKCHRMWLIEHCSVHLEIVCLFCNSTERIHNDQAVMMTSSNGTIFRVTGPLCGEFTGPGEFPAQRPVTQSFDVFFDLRLNKRLSKQPWGWWFETPKWSLWRQWYGWVQWGT